MMSRSKEHLSVFHSHIGQYNTNIRNVICHLNVMLFFNNIFTIDFKESWSEM